MSKLNISNSKFVIYMENKIMLTIKLTTTNGFLAIFMNIYHLKKFNGIKIK